MPAWGIHLVTAKEISKHIEIKQNEFILGNILPDIPNGNIVTSITNKIEYNKTHYINPTSDKYNNLPKLPDIELFLQNNKDYLNTSIGLGYLVHLLTDYYWNKEIINRYLKLDEDNNFNRQKQLDLNFNERHLINKYKITKPIYKEESLEKIKHLLDINSEDVIKSIEYIDGAYVNNKINYNYSSKLITESDMDEIYNESIVYITKELTKLKIM